MVIQKSKKIRVDEQGIIDDALIHDAEIVSFSKEQNGNQINIFLGLRSVSGVQITLALFNVKVFFGEALMQQNIVLEILLLKGRDAKKEVQELAELLHLKHTMVDFFIKAIDKSDLCFVQLVPSNGLEAYSVCERIELFE